MTDVWTITELPRGEAATPGETFVWSAATTPPTANGGGRAAPRAPWTFGGTQRTKRTDYTGARTPSVQVLGPSKKPQTLEGTFDDRYNFPGYAKAEQRRLEDMIDRGNLCRVSFQGQAFVGIFTEQTYPYRRDWQIGYSIVFDVHARAEDYDISDRSPELELSPVVTFNAVDLATSAALSFHDTAPRPHLAGDTIPNTEANLAQLVSDVDQLGRTLDNREITPPESPVDGYTRLATQFRTVQGSAYALLLQLGAVRSDTELVVQTPLAVLGFETWSRSLRYAARITLGRAAAGERSCAARATPDAQRLYRPSQGESLYAIARKFYGAPHAWRAIFDRNHLTSVILTGREILVIPERGAS